jgi:hypothetical protein
MSLTERHPSFIERSPDWGLMHDSYAGERTVKAAGDRYLPPTAGMVANGYGKVTPTGAVNLGQAAYDAYRKRALYPDAVKKTITGLLGMIHRKPPVIEVPAALQPMVDRATIAGETIEVLWRRITEAQLLDGRCGLLVDIPSGRSIGEGCPTSRSTPRRPYPTGTPASALRAGSSSSSWSWTSPASSGSSSCAGSG